MSGLFALFNRGKKAVASAAVATVVAAAGAIVHVTQANLWRDMFNPLRGLTMRRVVTLLEEGERGAYADLQWTFRYIEKRDATLRGGKRSLLSGVGEKGWKVVGVPDEQLPPGATIAMRDRQVVTLRQQYDAIDNVRAAIEHLGLAEFRGYAHLEKHYTKGGPNDGQLCHLEPVEQWYLCRPGLRGAWYYNERSDSGKTVTDTLINPDNFIIREIDDPIDEIALICFVRKSLSQKDWDGFIETFGIPSIFFEMPQSVPAGKEAEYQATVERIQSDAKGKLPFGTKVHTVGGTNLGTPPFGEHIKYQDQQIVMAITSGLLTMLAESGSGTLAGGAHSETFDRVVRALAKRISEVFQQQLDKPFFEETFPNEPILAYFEIKAEQETDSSEFIKDVRELKEAGYETDPSQIEETTGLRVTKESAVPAEPEAEPEDPAKDSRLKNRRKAAAAASQEDGLAALLGVKSEWVAPVRKEWAELIAKIADETVNDDDLFDFLDAAADRLPELFDEMEVEEFAEMLAATQGEAFLEGVRETLRKKKESKQ